NVSRQRAKVVPELASAVTAAMQELGMGGGRFEVATTPQAEPQAHGLESIEFLGAGHAGSAPRPLAKVACGRGRARLAPAVAAATGPSRRDVPMPVPTWHRARGPPGTGSGDAAGSGAGGGVVDAAGGLLQRLGRARQARAVAHLAEAAACRRRRLLAAQQWR